MTKRAEAIAHGPDLIRRFLLIGIIGAVIAMTMEYAYYRLMPRAWFFTYYGVAVVNPVYGNVPITMASDSQITHSLRSMRWNDVLICDLKDGNGFRNHDSENDFKDNVEPQARTTTIWTLDVKAPPGTVCYVRSAITAVLPHDIQKKQVIIGEKFTPI